VTGLAASVVYWPPEPKFCAGAPTSPENTWFQTALVQPSRLLLRTKNCCWLPLSTVLAVNCESAMKPPLE
jgi:hypothetical protein